MALPSSGAISLNQMHVEVGGGSGSNCSINDSDIRGLIGKGSGSTMSFSEWYGASAVQPPSLQTTAYGTTYTAPVTGKNFSPASIQFTNSQAASIVNQATTVTDGHSLFMNDYGIVTNSSNSQFGGAGVWFRRGSDTSAWSNSYNFTKNHGTGAGQHYIKIYYGSSLLLTSNVQYDYNNSQFVLMMGNTGVTGIIAGRSSASSWRVEYYG